MPKFFVSFGIIILYILSELPKIAMFPFGILKSFLVTISGKFAPKIIFLRFNNSHPHGQIQEEDKIEGYQKYTELDFVILLE